MNKPFAERIAAMNAMYKLPANDQPTLPADTPERLAKFKATLMDEVHEIDEIVALANNGGSAAEVAVAIADVLGDIIVYCRSEALKYGLPLEEVLDVIMDSNESKLGADGKPIYDANGNLLPEVTLQKHEIGDPVIYGRFAVLHLDDEMKAELRGAEHAILYKQQLRQDFVIESADLRLGSSIKQRLEITGLFQRLIFGIISLARLRQNKYRDINPTTTSDGLPGQWLSSFSLIVNSQERVLPWPTKLYQDVAQNTQLKRDVERDLYFVVFGVSPDAEPAGALNLARTQKVLLSLDLVINPIDPAVESRQAFGAVMGEAWNIMDIKDGVARLRFVD